jgi:UDP-3-O-[3-hydroxymyristoyl] glucosamine N-acyltransferase
MMDKVFQTTLSELGEKLNLQVIGDGSRVVAGMAPLEKPSPNALCLVRKAKDLAALDENIPLLGKPEFFSGFSGRRLGLAAPRPREIVPVLLTLFYPPAPPLRGVHPSAVVSPDAKVSGDAWIGPLCVVEAGAVVKAGAQLTAGVYVEPGVVVGADSVLKPHAVLLQGTRVGKACLLHAGCVLGCDGFGFVTGTTSLIKIPSVGRTIVGDNVEIGACAAIDRGLIGDTVIGSGTKIDSHVHIGHNSKIGRNCMICSMSGTAGNAVLEDAVTISAQAGVVGRVRVGKRAILYTRTVATNDVPPEAAVSGFPARPHGETKRAQILSTRLPELYERVKRLERCVNLDGEDKK